MDKIAKDPFRFYTASYLFELTGRKASNLREFLEGLRQVTGSSIFYHTFQAIRERHFATHIYTNDFAIWVSHYLGNHALGERLANINPLEFPSIRALRNQIIQVVEEAIAKGNAEVSVPPGKEFCFNQAISIIMPTDYIVYDLTGFAEALKQVPPYSLFFHLFEARLRLGHPTNDFSAWLEHSMGEQELAQRIDRLDFMMYSLEELRDRLLEIVTEK